MRELIIETEKYILELCDKSNYKIVINYILNANYYRKINNDNILIFSINYNNYNYLYNLKMHNNKLLFSIHLKNNKYKQISLENSNDFNKLVKAMINDKKK